MDDPEELGKLTDRAAKAWMDIAEGRYESALEGFSEVADAAHEHAISLARDGADPGVVLHWTVEAAQAFGVAVAMQAEAGDVRAVADSLGKLGELANAVDLNEIVSLNSGECIHGRITYEDNKCRRRPCS
ncbi:hypothetical protein [Streptomyces rishiriensis]|uniref:hypothetical protein n=1 Tax=Streptomyces rishiriensis TaxID=68264 RepID=UPI00131EEE16|nr:hypothetical protein [Streptomyces rishiriensis]